MTRIEINKHIVADPEICHGKLTFKGTRVMVWQVLELLAERESYQKILKAFPSLRSTHIHAALQYASSLTKENYVIINLQPSLSFR